MQLDVVDRGEAMVTLSKAMELLNAEAHELADRDPEAYKKDAFKNVMSAFWGMAMEAGVICLQFGDSAKTPDEAIGEYRKAEGHLEKALEALRLIGE
jgi:hypothetical protein